MNYPTRFQTIVAVVYLAISLVCQAAIITLQIDAIHNRQIASAQRQDLKEQNTVIERQNDYKICILESLWRNTPETRTEAQLQTCKRNTLGL